MVPRISMIVGIDTLGNVFCSITQANSNAAVMRIFFAALVKKLDRERSNWRNDTIIVLDNAKYHGAESTLKVFESLRIPVAFLGPHSYDAAPCELFFAWFKSVDINPLHEPTGKK
jgi:transposase